MPQINILHLTDIHFGQPAMEGRWPTIRAQFFDDLKYLVGKTGPVPLVALTGDVANRADPNEYDQASEVLADLGLMLFAETGLLPQFAVVPGNHDVNRPQHRTAAQRVIEELWNAETEREFFSDSAADTRRFVEHIFRPYTDWLQRTPIDLLPPDHTGVLPGEFSATLEFGGVRVGIIGLNSAFRHISDRASVGSLTLTGRQANTASGGDLPAWAARQNVSIVLTHHPMSWISEPDEATDALFNDATSVRVHLCGHLHEERYELSGAGGPGTRVVHQGQSLFGLEFYGDRASRMHGYAILAIDFQPTSASLRVWPREAVKTGSGTFRIDRKGTFGLQRGSEVSSPVPLTASVEPPSSQTIAPQGRVDTGGPRPESLSSPHGHQPTSVAGATSTDDALDSLLAAIATGTLVGVIGDREVPALGKTEMPFAHFRQSVWTNLAIGSDDDGVISTDQIVSMLAARDSGLVKRLVAEHFGYPEDSAIDEMRRILNAPWAGMLYLSPLRDLEEAWTRADLESHTRLFDATRDAFRLPAPTDSPVVRLATCVPVEGTTELALSDLGNLVGVSARTSHLEWLQYARRLLARSPSVFLVDSLRSLDAWKLLSDRGGPNSRFRPPAFVVSEQVEPQFAATFERLGVEWVRMSVAKFTREVIPTSRAEVSEGRRRRAHRASSDSLRSVALEPLKRASEPGNREYLLGRTPRWGDVVDGFAEPLSSQLRLQQRLEQAQRGEVHVVGGTAGAGRTTALMQCALALHTPQKQVAWISSSSSHSRLGEIVDDVVRAGSTYVIVDDIDVFGAEAARFLQDLRGSGENARVVVVGVRSVRDNLIESVPGLVRHPIGELSASDVDLLVELLLKNNAVANRRLSKSDLSDLLTSGARSQLLVGMIQATSGLSFADKIASECRQLSPLDLVMYGCIALVTSERETMTIDQAMQAVSAEAQEAWHSFNRLDRSGLIALDLTGQSYELRHRVIAEAVRSYISDQGLLLQVVRGTLRSFAAAAADMRDPSIPVRRTLIRLLNHSYLIDLGLEPSHIRECYDAVESLLSDDFQYWLQRGAFEVERGDSILAMHNLTSAMTSPGGDQHPKVLTEYAYLRLRLAAKLTNIETTRMAIDAIEDLHGVIRRQGEMSPHSFTVLARDGVKWLKESSLAESNLARLAEESLRLLRFARRLESTNGEIARWVPSGIGSLEALLSDNAN
jgi:predicted MPP superfamily phosphohydrolase